MAKTATWRNTPFAHQFYHSKAWLDVRRLVIERAHGLCERCAEDGKTTRAEVVHHRVPLCADNMDDASITLNPDNLMALCHDCHTVLHQEMGIGALNGRRREPEPPRVTFDAEGNLVKL